MAYGLPLSVLQDFAEILQIEFVHIGNNTTIDQLSNQLRWNDLYYKLEGK